MNTPGTKVTTKKAKNQALMYALNQHYDEVRNGARLVLTYDAPRQLLQRHGAEHH